MSPFGIAALSLSVSADAFEASIARGAFTRPNWLGAPNGALVFGMVLIAIGPAILVQHLGLLGAA